ncbi:MAG TPA: hypothetical protein VE087_10905, partial [Xanthobacteraceae bacterium]|nr:hypothetical protein [Xanthobacteraceae bacterium]
MSNRSAKFASALVASILAGANFTAMAENATKPADTKTADACLSGPKGTAPAGSHWYYHLDRATRKQCWYLGEAKNKTARTVAAPQPAAPAADDATAADATPSQAQPQPQTAMRKSVANARAEWPSPQAAAAPVTTADAAQPGGAASDPGIPGASADATAASSPVTARWLDASSMAGSNGTRHAAAQPSAVEPAAPPRQANAIIPAAAAAVEAPAEKTSSSTQMLLIVMLGALALAGLVSALVFRQTRTRTPPYDIRDEWRAPWDSLHAEPAPPNRDRPLR